MSAHLAAETVWFWDFTDAFKASVEKLMPEVRAQVMPLLHAADELAAHKRVSVRLLDYESQVGVMVRYPATNQPDRSFGDAVAFRLSMGDARTLRDALNSVVKD